MGLAPQRSEVLRSHRRKRFPWLLAMLVSLGFIAILAFVIVALLIIHSQGISQGINTLTIISIIVGFVISVLSLLISFLQWHRPEKGDRPEPSLVPPPQVSDGIPLSPNLSTAPYQQEVDSWANLLPSPVKRHRPIDWGEAPDSEPLYGREKELVELKHWLTREHCRLVAILGMGGIGKTSLAATLVDQIQEHFDCVFWRSLHNAPPVQSLLRECIQFVSARADTVLSEELDSQISLLLEYLRTHCCLLVLDNVETILQGGSQAGHYREGYEGYGRLLQRIGRSRHQSCLLVTSREKPPEVALLEGKAVAIRSYYLAGLLPLAGQKILKDKGLHGAEHDWEVLISHYGGNPLVLKLVAQMIHEVFGGTITAFLKDGEFFFRDVRDVLEQQMKRLSTLEEEIVYWLAIEREAIALSNLQERIVLPMSKGELQEALRSLRRRQLIETRGAGFTLHHVILEYLTDRFVERVCEEIKTERLAFFERHAVLLASAKDYIRESQCRLIVQPLLQRLLTIFGKEVLPQRFQSLLATLHKQYDHHPGYTAGNVLNLLIQMGCTLRGYDFSGLVVQQAYLQGVDLLEVNFAYADLATSVFTDTFGTVLCVAFSPQGGLLAGGTLAGEIRFWHSASGLPLQTFWGHTNSVRSVAFSPNGKTLASGSDDRTVCLWEVSSGKVLTSLQGHASLVSSVAFSPDGKTLASGSGDQTVCLWEVSSGKLLNTLQGHSHWVSSVAFSPDGKILASGSGDRVVRLWEVSSGEMFTTLQGHASLVRSVTFSPDGKTLASSGEDQTVRLWEVSSGKMFTTLQGHANAVWSIAFSPDGKTLASGSYDRTVRLWEVSSGKALNTLQGHTDWVYSVAFSPDGKILASSGGDQTVCLWEVSSGKLLNTLQGHSHWVFSVAFSPDGKILASGSYDRAVRLWEVSSGKMFTSLQGHANAVRSVAFSPDGKTLASSSDDRTVRLWEVSSGKVLTSLQGHSHWVSLVTFSPDGKTLASSGEDRTVRLWEVSSGKVLTSLQGHANAVWSIAFSPDGKTLASGSYDRTVRLWEVSSGRCLKTLQGHSHWVYSVAFSPDGKILASGGEDGIIRFWDMQTAECLHTLRSDRPYERMNITRVKGLTEAQKATLRSLGAIEDEEQPQQGLP